MTKKKDAKEDGNGKETQKLSTRCKALLKRERWAYNRI
jgi:hypothetical protein